MLIRRATLSDVDLVAPQFDLYRQFYQQPPIRNWRGGSSPSGWSATSR
jgi:hypothetical protein